MYLPLKYILITLLRIVAIFIDMATLYIVFKLFTINCDVMYALIIVPSHIPLSVRFSAIKVGLVL